MKETYQKYSKRLLAMLLAAVMVWSSFPLSLLVTRASNNEMTADTQTVVSEKEEERSVETDETMERIPSESEAMDENESETDKIPESATEVESETEVETETEIPS